MCFFTCYLLIEIAGDEVVAIASMQNDPIVSHCSELLSLGKMLSVQEIKAGKVRFRFRTTRFRDFEW